MLIILSRVECSMFCIDHNQYKVKINKNEKPPILLSIGGLNAY